MPLTTPTPDMLPFLAAIRAAPADDAPRLVFADWLDEAGYCVWGELIRVQCELARLPLHDDRREALVARETACLAQPDALPVVKTRPRSRSGFERGLVRLDCNLDRYEYPRLPSYRVPVQTAWLDTLDLECVSTNDLPPVEFTAQAIRCGLVFHDGVATLSHIEQLQPIESRLRRLTVRLADDSPLNASITALCQLRCDALESLGIFDTTVNAEAVEQLTLAAWPTLKRLHLTNCDLTGELVEQLCERWATRLDTLDVRYNLIGDAGLIALCRTRLLRECDYLDYTQSSITARGVSALASYSEMSECESLILNLNTIGDAGLTALAGSPYVRRLRYLSVMSCDIGDTGIEALCESPYLTNLQTLHLDGNRITDQGAQALADCIWLPAFKYISYAGNPISATGQADLYRRFGNDDDIPF